MPVEWQVDHVRRLVVTDAHGTLTGEEILRYQREVWSRPDVAGYDELVDMSDVQDTQPTTKLIQELAALSAAMDPEGSRSKFAIVARSRRSTAWAGCTKRTVGWKTEAPSE
jgi:hypothetical protein